MSILEIKRSTLGRLAHSSFRGHGISQGGFPLLLTPHWHIILLERQDKTTVDLGMEVRAWLCKCINENYRTIAEAFAGFLLLQESQSQQRIFNLHV